jgi:purine-cytosine permease-like protein
MKTVGKLEWFGGNEEALAMYQMFVDLAHTWDDLVDKDKEVSENAINNAFSICLIYLPMNRFYQAIQYAVLPMWISVVSAYQTANHYEKNKDEHGVEIAHGLRYAVGNIIAYAVHVCVGPEKAAELMPEVWKHIMIERYDNYRKEHLNG